MEQAIRKLQFTKVGDSEYKTYGYVQYALLERIVTLGVPVSFDELIRQLVHRLDSSPGKLRTVLYKMDYQGIITVDSENVKAIHVGYREVVT